MDNFNNEQQAEESFLNIDFKKFFSDVLKLWWLFVLSIITSIGFLYVYHKYTRPTYSSEITLIIDQDGDGRNNFSQSSNMIDGFMLTPGMRNIDNQIAILGSRSMIKRVIEEMGIYISYYHQGRVVASELYPNQPFSIDMDSTHVQPINTPIKIIFTDSLHFSLYVEAEQVNLYNYSTQEFEGKIDNLDYSSTFQVNQPIITNWCAFTIRSNKTIKSDDYFVRFEYPDNLIDKYRNSLQIIRDQQTNSSVLTLKAIGTRPQKTVDFLNKLALLYINDNLTQKNLIAENTINFIENQLVSLSDSLDDIGTRLSNFRANHGLQQSASAKGNALFTELQDYERQIQEQQLFLTYYNYLENYFSSDTILNSVIAPAVFDTKSPIITQQLNQIMQLNNEKQAYQDTYGKSSNPVSRELIAKLQIARSTLLKSITSHKNMVNDNMNELRLKESTCRNELMSLPETERIYLGIDRKFTLNNDVYNFLLRKRSESQIQKASNTPDHKILDPAITIGQVSPNYRKNRIFALAIAILIPLTFILLRQLLDNKIRTSEDVNRIAKYPIIGEIPNNSRNTPFIVLKHPKSISAEAFRRMRSRIEFMVTGKEHIVIAVSSSMPSEGKTFCSINIASVFAINGRKTILLGFDLRKPSLSQIIDKKSDIGLSNYIIGNCTMDDAIQHIDNNFDVMFAGAIPPNPAELISSKKSSELINNLKEKYDVIIIDTPPMGYVSDAYTIARWSDTLLFISRLDYTIKDALNYTVSTFEGEGIKNIGLVLNDTNSKKSRYGYGKYGHYGYGKYGYGHYGKYGYGKYGYTDEKTYGYYTED